MTQKEKAQYWLDIVEEDLELVDYLFAGRKWLYTAFMCHQVIEKLLKAYWTLIRDDAPPYIHEHKRLVEGCGLLDTMNEQQLTFLEIIRPMNIEARYPSYKRNVASRLNEDVCRYLVESTKGFKEWILQKF